MAPRPARGARRLSTLRVVLTGAECTGKSTLAGHLAARFGCPWVPEYARAYAAERGGPLSYADVTPIARGQLAAVARALARGPGLLVQDTDFVSTLVYSQLLYGDCPAWVEAEGRRNMPALYLLLHPDVPWQPDPVREQADRRREQHALFAATLARLGAPVVHVAGDWALRFRTASSAISALPGLAD